MPFTWRWSAVAQGGDNDSPRPGYFCVPGELVVNAADATDAELAQPNLAGVPRRAVASMEAVIYTVDSIGDGPEIADSILEVDENLRVAPHHALRGDPWYEGGPAAQPQPADPAWSVRSDRAGDAVTIGVLDTGVVDHPELAGGQVVDLGGEPDTWDEDGDDVADYESGHGTFVSGLIVREAPGATQHVLRTLSGHGWTTEEKLCDHIDKLVAEGPLDILNLSLGGYAFRQEPPVGLVNALKRLPPGVAIVAAAGNYDRDYPFYPAALAADGSEWPQLLSVGAVDIEGQAPYKAVYSNFGEWVRVCAPGTATAPFLTYSAARDGSSAPPSALAAGTPISGIPPQDITQYDGWATWRGTSFAAPQVSAALAVIMWAGAAASGAEAVEVLAAAGLPWVGNVGALVTRAGVNTFLGI